MTRNPLTWFRAIRYTWIIHRKTRHLPPRQRQKVLIDVQQALYDGRPHDETPA
jgi:hypothetical protein